jgi:hypothetical protein
MITFLLIKNWLHKIASWWRWKYRKVNNVADWPEDLKSIYLNGFGGWGEGEGEGDPISTDGR